MKVLRWGRWFGDGIEYGNASTFLSFGIRGSGKSTLLESIGMEYAKLKSPILDLFGSRDGESLAWLRSPEVQGMKVLLLHGDNTDVSSSFDSKPVSKYSVSDLEKYGLIISSSPLYSSPDEEYKSVNKVIDEVYSRSVWTRPAFMIVREAANLLYSRLKVSPDQTLAKAEMTYFIREARHCGFSLGIDTQKLSSIDIDIRITIDYLFLKSLGIQGLPDDLRFLYKTYVPVKLQNMPQKNFVLLTRVGSHGVGDFPFHAWHKRPGEDIMRAVGVEAHHGAELIQSKPNYIVGDLQHAQIVKLKQDRRSFKEIATTMSLSSGSTYAHVSAHNKEIQLSGECSKCTRAKSELKCTQVSTT